MDSGPTSSASTPPSTSSSTSWLYCNICWVSVSHDKFLFSSCGHIFCHDCGHQLTATRKSPCLVCTTPCTTLAITKDQAPPEVLQYFQDPDMLFEKAMKVYKFQKEHQHLHLQYLLSRMGNEKAPSHRGHSAATFNIDEPAPRIEEIVPLRQFQEKETLGDLKDGKSLSPWQGLGQNTPRSSSSVIMDSMTDSLAPRGLINSQFGGVKSHNAPASNLRERIANLSQKRQITPQDLTNSHSPIKPPTPQKRDLPLEGGSLRAKREIGEEKRLGGPALRRDPSLFPSFKQQDTKRMRMWPGAKTNTSASPIDPRILETEE